MADLKHPREAQLGRLVVVGLGLIGGSFAKGIRATGLFREVVGVDLDAESRRLAVELGVVDRCEAELAAACQGADVIQLAVPILVMEKVLAQLAKLELGQAIITDVGSAKGNLVRAARQAFGHMPARFVPQDFSFTRTTICLMFSEKLCMNRFVLQAPGSIRFPSPGT